MILARKIVNIPEFLRYLTEKLTKFPNFTRFLPENSRILHNKALLPEKKYFLIFSPPPLPPVSFAYASLWTMLLQSHSPNAYYLSQRYSNFC